MAKALEIVFMGTPDFAVPCLEALVKGPHRVVLTVTQPDRPRGRGRKAHAPPVKRSAEALGIETVQPDSVKSPEFVRRMAERTPDLFVVVAFGQLLPRALLEIPRRGAVNVHASLLPKYRGSAPIQWAIINREPVTGVTTMLLDEGMDTGDLLLSREVPIGPTDTAAVLHDRLSLAGAKLLSETLDSLAEGSLRPTVQDPGKASYAPMLTKADGHLDWSRAAEDLEAFIRGMTPWPGAYTFHGDRRIKIFRAEPVWPSRQAAPGTVLPGFPDELRVAAGQGALSLLEVQGASGKRLPVADFLRGHPIPPGTLLV